MGGKPRGIGEFASQPHDLEPGSVDAFREIFTELAVDEDQTTASLRDAMRLDVDRAGFARRMQREAVQRREIGESPVLVARRGRRERIRAFQRVGAKLLQPLPGTAGCGACEESRKKTAGCLSFHGAQAACFWIQS